MTTASPYCPGCFRPKPPGVEMCGFCGYDESAERPPSLLPYWSRLRGGKYVVGRALGMGGFAITYLAWDQNLRRLVAIKELFPQGAAARGTDRASVVSGSGGRQGAELFRYALRRFLDEARTVAGFNHPGIVKVLDFFGENGTGYMVMDYYPGGTLEELLKERFADRPMPEADALGLMRPVLEGLAVVHGKGWLHRDIKPGNIYLADWRQPVLLDFGAARIALGEASRSLTAIITPGYAPPEQYTSKGSKQGPWTDIYACAAVLYRMLSGQTPPAAPDRQMGEDELRPLAELRPDIRPVVAGTVDRGLNLAIEDRPRDIGVFLNMLDGKPVVGAAYSVEELGEIFGIPNGPDDAAQRPEETAPNAATGERKPNEESRPPEPEENSFAVICKRILSFALAYLIFRLIYMALHNLFD